MNDDHSKIELLLRYVDNNLASDEQAHVEELLRQDQSARKMLREIAQQAVVVADVARIHRPSLSTTTGESSKLELSRDVQSRWATYRGLSLASAAIVILTMTLALLRPGGEPEIVTVKAVNGPVEWTGGGGHVSRDLTVGRSLPGGTIELLSAESWVVFEFLDQSTITLSGQAAATVSGQTQKELHLRYGSLSANVQPQPTAFPMLVHTPSAELKVLGTQFNIDALPKATRLVVNEGRVRLKRLTDGDEVDVPANHEVTAALEDERGLAVNTRGKAVTVWESDLRTDVVHGVWLSNERVLRLRLNQAVASGQMTEADATAEYKNAAEFDTESGSVWGDATPIGVLILLSVDQSSSRPVLLTANASIRIQGRMHSRGSVSFGITTKKSAGGFGGKYSITIDEDAFRGDDNGFDMTLPLSRFSEETQLGDALTGKELCDWWCVAESTSAKIEITNVELIESSN